MNKLDEYIKGHSFEKFSIRGNNCLTFVLDFYREHMDKDLYPDLPHDYLLVPDKERVMVTRLKRNGFEITTEKDMYNIVICPTEDSAFPFIAGLRYNESYVVLRAKQGVTMRQSDTIKEWRLV